MKKITLFSLLVMAAGIITAQTNWTLNGATWEKNITPDILKFEGKTTAQMQANIFTSAGGANPSTGTIPVNDSRLVDGYLAVSGGSATTIPDLALTRQGFNIVQENVGGVDGTFLRYAYSSYTGTLSNDVNGNAGTKSGLTIWNNLNVWFPSKFVKYGSPYKLKYTYDVWIQVNQKVQQTDFASATTIGTAYQVVNNTTVGGAWKTVSYTQSGAQNMMTMRFENLGDAGQLLYFKTPTFLLTSATEPTARTITVTNSGAGATTAQYATVRDLDQQVFTFTPGSGQTLVSVTYNGTNVTSQVLGGKFTTPILTADATLSVVYSNKPTWIGESLATIGGSAGTWYKCSASSTYSPFNGASLGDFASSIQLGGEAQVYPNSADAARMGYTIDGGTTAYISLPKTTDINNNSKHYGDAAIDISALSTGTHSLAVWFEAGVSPNVVYDSNLSANYVATFTKTATGVKNASAANFKLTVTGNQLNISNLNKGDLVTVYGISGKCVYNKAAAANEVALLLDKGVYVVKVNQAALKVVM